MDSFHSWWATVPGWAKPVLLAFALPTILGLLLWILGKGIPSMRRAFNIWILEKLERTEARIREREHVDESRPEVLEQRVEEETHVWNWLIKRAKHWLAMRKKYGL